MIMVALAPSLIWPPKKPADRRLSGAADSAAVRDSAARLRPPPAPPTAEPPSRQTAAVDDDTVWVTSPLYRLGFSTLGGRLVSAELLKYQSFAPGDTTEPVDLIPPGSAFLRHRLMSPSGDTVSLEDWELRPSADAIVV